MTLSWPCGDPVLAAYVLQAAAASGQLPYPGLFAAAAAASRLLSLQRDLGGQVSSPMVFLKQLEASSRGGRGGFDRLMSLAGFGFPGLIPPLAPLQTPESLKSAELDVEAIASAQLAATEKQLQQGKSFRMIIMKVEICNFQTRLRNW